MPIIRWCVQRDFPAVLTIDWLSYVVPLREADLYELVLHEKNLVTLVAEDAERVIGFMQYQLGRGVLHIDRLAVNPDYRRQGVGRAFLSKIEGKLRHSKRSEATALVPESWLPTQLFFRACGWRCRHYYGPVSALDGDGILEFAHCWDQGALLIERIAAGNCEVIPCSKSTKR